jgi:hypothetical protein
MKLFIKNIGKIHETLVEINGITVIAGANNTGKSTVGRTLFAIFNSFYDIEEQIRAERINSISNLISLFYRNSIYSSMLRRVESKLAEDIVDDIETYINDTEAIKEKITEFIPEIQRNNEHHKISVDEDSINQVIQKIVDIVSVSEEEIIKAFLEKKLMVEFNGQINNLFIKEVGEIILQIQDRKIAVTIQDNRILSLDMEINLKTEAVYLDDPFVLDEFSGRISWNNPNYLDHRSHLKKKLFNSVYNSKEGNILEEILATNRFKSIYSKIATVCNGGVVVNEKRIGLSYSSGNADTDIDVRNLSTGLKTFVILKLLLQKGVIRNNGTIILDEPEIHLHPEWQVLFAELIVLIHKEFGMHILLNTHSPYFLEAIEVFASKYEVDDKCKYYLAATKDESSYLEDVTSNVEKIYEKLARPFQDLENERYRNG